MNKSGKSPLVSKTLIFNGIALITGVAVHYGYRDFQPPPEIAAFVTFAITVGGPIINALLRLVTREPIRIRPKWE